jgi:PBP1b-binding outer membrane lipoprotein LpoB
MALGKSDFRKAGEMRCSDSSLSQHRKPSQPMKKILCIVASAALLGACEQKTEVAPAAPAEKKTETSTTIVNPPATEKKETTNTLTTTQQPASVDTKQESKEETKTTTTTSSPNP